MASEITTKYLNTFYNTITWDRAKVFLKKPVNVFIVLGNGGLLINKIETLCNLQLSKVIDFKKLGSSFSGFVDIWELKSAVTGLDKFIKNGYEALTTDKGKTPEWFFKELSIPGCNFVSSGSTVLEYLSGIGAIKNASIDGILTLGKTVGIISKANNVYENYMGCLNGPDLSKVNKDKEEEYQILHYTSQMLGITLNYALIAFKKIGLLKIAVRQGMVGKVPVELCRRAIHVMHSQSANLSLFFFTTFTVSMISLHFVKEQMKDLEKAKN